MAEPVLERIVTLKGKLFSVNPTDGTKSKIETISTEYVNGKFYSLDGSFSSVSLMNAKYPVEMACCEIQNLFVQNTEILDAASAYIAKLVVIGYLSLEECFVKELVCGPQSDVEFHLMDFEKITLMSGCKPPLILDPWDSGTFEVKASRGTTQLIRSDQSNVNVLREKCVVQYNPEINLSLVDRLRVSLDQNKVPVNVRGNEIINTCSKCGSAHPYWAMVHYELGFGPASHPKGYHTLCIREQETGAICRKCV